MRASRWLTGTVAALALAIVSAPPMRAHKPITSKYAYTTDIYPIFRDRCGACHQPDGVGPMSLLTYQDARPWAQSIKDEVINLRMPPRYAEPGFGPVRNGHGLTAREIDMIVEWANGGTPQGPRELPTVAASVAETRAKADLELALPEFTLVKDMAEDTKTFTLPTGQTKERFVRRLEIVPGAPSIVRSVVVSAGGATLAAWQPGQDALAAAGDTAYPLGAKQDLTVRVRYKKTWKQESQAVTDRTTLKFWLADKRPSGVIQRIVTSGGNSLKQNVQLVALLPEISSTVDSVRVEAVRPDGSRQRLLLLTSPRPEWPARYGFEQPVALPAGSRLEVVTTPASADPRRVALQVEYTQRH